jgi:hypothetical protein
LKTLEGATDFAVIRSFLLDHRNVGQLERLQVMRWPRTTIAMVAIAIAT